MAKKPRKILSALKRVLQVSLIIAAACCLVLVGTVLWTFEVKLKRWPIFIYSAPLSINVGDEIATTRLFARLRRLGYTSSPDPVPEPGQWNRSDTELSLFLKYSPLKSERIVSGPVSFSLEWDRIRSIRLIRSLQQVDRITIEPELIHIIPADSDEAELCRAVPLDKIPSLLTAAIVLTEDARFFTHSGIDLTSMVRALKMNLRKGRYVQGGSTISQQLIRMAVLTPEKKLFRKINEVFLALAAEAIYSKETILQAYLNRVYLGHVGSLPIKGVAEAARNLFGKDLAALDAAECALIAAAIRAPNVINPYRHPERARSRRNMVLGLLLKAGEIPRETYDEAINAPVKMNKTQPALVRAPVFADLVKEYMPGGLPGTEVKSLRQDVVTSLDPLVQHEADLNVKALGKAASQAYVILVDPRSGEIRTLVAPTGSDRWSGKGGNPLTVLPFTIIPALVADKQEQPKYTLTSPFFVPSNTSGSVTLRRAFVTEKAFVRQQLGLALSPQRIAAVLKEFGFRAQPEGSGEIVVSPVTPMEMARGFSILATLGNAPVLHPGVRVEGEAPFEGRIRPKRIPVSAEGIYMVNHLMKEIGSASLAADGSDATWKQPSVFSAEDEGGLWSIAYRPDALVLVRAPGAGFDVPRVERMVKRLLPPLRGGVEATPRPPSGIVFRKICVDSGLRSTSICPRVIREPFLKGTQPSEWCPLRHDTGLTRSATGK